MSLTSPLAPKARYIRNALITVATAVGAFLFGLYVIAFLRLDAFSRLRPHPESSDEKVAVRLNGVTLRSWHKGKMAIKANVRRVDVMQDRQTFNLYDVTDGTYHMDKREIGFDTKLAVWSNSRRQLEVKKGGNVRNADFQLQVPAFRFDNSQAKLYVPGYIQGKFYGGDAKGHNLVYNAKTDEASLDDPSWQGKLEMFAQAGLDDQQDEQWNVTGKSGKNRGNTMTVVNGTATKTDTVIKADLIVYDRAKEIVTATGHVLYYSLKANMTCNKAVIYDKEKRAVMSENVTMLIKPKDRADRVVVEEIPPLRPVVPDEVLKTRPMPDKTKDDEVRSKESMRKYPTQVTSEQVEYWYRKGNRHAIITGHPQALQELGPDRWRRGWTHIAYYDGEKEMMKMVSTEGKKDTRVKTSLGDDFIANWFEASTKDEDTEDWDADAPEGKFVRRPDNGDTTTPPTGGTGTGKGGTTSGGGLRGPIGGRRGGF